MATIAARQRQYALRDFHWKLTARRQDHTAVDQFTSFDESVRGVIDDAGILALDDPLVVSNSPFAHRRIGRHRFRPAARCTCGSTEAAVRVTDPQ